MELELIYQDENQKVYMYDFMAKMLEDLANTYFKVNKQQFNLLLAMAMKYLGEEYNQNTTDGCSIASSSEVIKFHRGKVVELDAFSEYFEQITSA